VNERDLKTGVSSTETGGGTAKEPARNNGGGNLAPGGKPAKTGKSSIARTFGWIRNILTFCDLPIRKKFLLFAVGTAFWVLVISGIGLVTMFDISARSELMVEKIWPQEKTANIVIRKLRGANISVHNMDTFTDIESVHGDYRRAKRTLADSHAYLNKLLTGGQITDHMLATDQFAEPYRVLPVTSAAKRATIEQAIGKIRELESLVDELFPMVSSRNAKSAVMGNADARAALVEKISRYDNLTRDSVTILNDYAITVSRDWGKFTSQIRSRFTAAIVLLSVTLCITLALTAFFGILMSRSFERHLNDILTQIRALSSGELDLTKKIDETSRDELGVLSIELNKLMDTIGNVTTFKKIIEGDEGTEDIYPRLAMIFRNELGIEDCVIYEVSSNKNSMGIVYPPGAQGMEMHCHRDVQLDCGLCRAKRTGLIVSSLDFPRVCKYYLDGDDAGHLCIPVILGGHVGGVVQLVCSGMKQCDRVALDRKIRKAQQYVREAQPVLEAKRLMKTLKESTFKDPLTGLYNRRFLEDSSENIVAGILRRKTSLGLLMCDLDFFKETNDVYGHDVGDLVLKETSDAIRRSVRASDLVVRFGGEEFLVLLMDTTSEGIVASAEKIRAAVEQLQVKVSGGGFIRKTISIGVSEFPGDTQNFWGAIKYADVALYRAKDSGRNQVMRFTQEMWTQERY
jgi:two-component system cell cycle response regulator